MLAGYNLRQIPHHFGVQPKTDPLRCDMLLCNPGRSFVIITQCIYILQLSTGVQPKTDPLSFWGTTKDRSPILSGYNLRQIPFGRRFLFAHICRNSLFIICSLQNSSYCLLSTIWRFLFAHICRNSLFIICSLQNSSYCLLSTISGIFTINALLQQPCVPFHFDKQASFATSTPTNFCLQNHKCILLVEKRN